MECEAGDRLEEIFRTSVSFLLFLPAVCERWQNTCGSRRNGPSRQAPPVVAIMSVCLHHTSHVIFQTSAVFFSRKMQMSAFSSGTPRGLEPRLSERRFTYVLASGHVAFLCSELARLCDPDVLQLSVAFFFLKGFFKAHLGSPRGTICCICSGFVTLRRPVRFLTERLARGEGSTADNNARGFSGEDID